MRQVADHDSMKLLTASTNGQHCTTPICDTAGAAAEKDYHGSRDRVPSRREGGGAVGELRGVTRVLVRLLLLAWAAVF